MDNKKIMIVDGDKSGKMNDIIKKLQEDGYTIVISDGINDQPFSKEKLLELLSLEKEFEQSIFSSPYFAHQNYVDKFQKYKKPRK